MDIYEIMAEYYGHVSPSPIACQKQAERSWLIILKIQDEILPCYPSWLTNIKVEFSRTDKTETSNCNASQDLHTEAGVQWEEVMGER